MIPESYGIERLNVSALTAFSGNPRTHSDTQIDQIAASIREFGWTNPILVDAAGVIIAGHGRLAAATRLGLDQVPVIRLGHLSDAQRKALVIADNQLALNAGWDEVALSNLVRELEAEKFELDLLGFDGADLDRYLAGLEDEAVAAAVEAELPEVPLVPTSRPGDLWILGNHRLLCGDATVFTDVERLMGGQLADMAFCDAPYNVDYANASKNKALSKDRRILNDALGDGFYQFLYDTCVNLLMVTKGIRCPAPGRGGHDVDAVLSGRRLRPNQNTVTGTNDIGPKYEWLFHAVDFIPSSSISLISDEWGTLELSGECAAVSGSFGTITDLEAV